MRYLIVHQPCCSNVVAIDGRFGGPQTRLYQGGRREDLER
jgi:hypothetical protein